MIVQSKKGNIIDKNSNKNIDWLKLEWHETRKRIFRKKTTEGRDISIKFLNENPELTEGDILFEDDNTIIAATVLPCECIVIKPINMFEMASVCYEIGNKHLPLFYEEGSLLVPFDVPLMRLLLAQGYDIKKEERKLLQSLKTTVTPHSDGSNSLFSKIMKLTNQ